MDDALTLAARDFDPATPNETTPALARAHATMSTLETDRWVAGKRIDLLEAVRSCAADSPDPRPAGQLSLAH